MNEIVPREPMFAKSGANSARPKANPHLKETMHSVLVRYDTKGRLSAASGRRTAGRDHQPSRLGTALRVVAGVFAGALERGWTGSFHNRI